MENGEIVLCQAIPLLGSALGPDERLCVILCNAVSVEVARAKLGLRLLSALFG
jgi:hypothetical protein